jgi:hypothetical protein
MYVFRVREYKTDLVNPNVPEHRLEATTEFRAANFADIDSDWIYFYADLIA